MTEKVYMADAIVLIDDLFFQAKLHETSKLTGVTLDNIKIKGGDLWGATVVFDNKTGPDGMKVTMTSDHPKIIPNATFDVDGGVSSDKCSGLVSESRIAHLHCR